MGETVANLIARQNYFQDPRSHLQAAAAGSAPSSSATDLDPNFTTLVVDILECRNVGSGELVKPGAANFIRVHVDPAHAKHQNVAMFTETEGSKKCNWNEKFAIAMFDLSSASAAKLLGQSYTEYKQFISSRPKGRKNVTKKKYFTIDVSIKCGYLSDPQTLSFGDWTPVVFQLKLNKRKERILKKAHWVKFSNGAHMRLRIELISSRHAPNLANFLPYTQWPPMVLHTGKTRLQLMMEEEMFSETPYAGHLGRSLLSYSPSTLPRILGVFSDDCNRDFLLVLGIALGAPLVDRTATLSVSRVAVAGPDEFPLVERRSYVLRPGSEHFVSLSAVDTVATADIRKLETHSRGCYFPEELQLRFHSNYSQVM